MQEHISDIKMVFKMVCRIIVCIPDVFVSDMTLLSNNVFPISRSYPGWDFWFHDGIQEDIVDIIMLSKIHL